MKKLVLILPMIAIVGCTSINATGPGWSLKTHSFLWDRANVSASVATNGVTSFHEDTSTPDEQAIAQLSQTLVSLVASMPK